ncbi:MAG TPA: helix-turn-helix domain-containing protein [Pseudonocardiaceae bacterium]
MCEVRRSARVTRTVRMELAAQVRVAYERGASIRSIVAARGYSYGLSRALLVESGVALRGRGGTSAAPASPPVSPRWCPPSSCGPRSWWRG